MKKITYIALAMLSSKVILAAPAENLPLCENQGFVRSIGELIVKTNNLSQNIELRISNISSAGGDIKLSKKSGGNDSVNCKAMIEVFDTTQKVVAEKLNISYGAKAMPDGQYQLFFNPVRN